MGKELGSKGLLAVLWTQQGATSGGGMPQSEDKLTILQIKTVTMIEFHKNVEQFLSYDRTVYNDFLDDDKESTISWHGLSFQLLGNTNGFDWSVEQYQMLFHLVVEKFDNDVKWVVNHEYMDLKWFGKWNSDLINLRYLFDQNRINMSFIGCLVLSKDALLRYSKDLITYPYVLHYKELDISHQRLPFIIKTTNNLNINFLSTDIKLLKDLPNLISMDAFRVIPYNGTRELWDSLQTYDAH